jgi:hypothetical protein
MEAISNQNSLLRQKARTTWAHMGDENNKYFHACIKARRISSNITAIYDDLGNKITSQQGITDEFIRFYTFLLGTSVPTSTWEEGTMKNGPLLTEEMRNILSLSVEASEIKNAMFSLANEKAPGPDGYNAFFFKYSSDIIGPDIINAVQEFFQNGKMLTEIYATALALIPTLENASVPADFRPIACCKYKCISKILASRLKKVLVGIISPSQGAFVQFSTIFYYAKIWLETIIERTSHQDV